MISSDILEKLKKLQNKGLVENAFLNINKWLQGDEYQEFWLEIEDMIEAGNILELNESFFQVIPFGTGGRRGKMGAGTNRINNRTIAESAQGFAEYLFSVFGKEASQERGVVITYDVRHHSKEFAEITASVFAANGLKVYFFKDIRSTPQLSFTIRYQNAIGGAMISASHNPPSDNGIKVFWEHGGQVVPPHDLNIIEKVGNIGKIKIIEFQQAVKEKKVIMLDSEADQAYAKTVGSLSLGDYRDAKIIFTPLHGCASTSFLPVLHHVGFKNIIEVKEQMILDPDFSTVPRNIPNPEVPVSLDLAIKYAQREKADIVLASDPDADRIGVVSRRSYNSDEYIFLNGNQIGVLIFDYIVKQLKKQGKLPQNGVMIKTVVTTDLLTKIAQDNQLKAITDLPVGFKYIADAIEKLKDDQFVFGAEESHGYLYGDYARDKDGAVGALMICEYASLLKKEERTLFEQLEEIKKQYGYYRELLQSVIYLGMEGMDKMLKIMDVLRAKLSTEFAGLKVKSVLDQLNKKVIDPIDNKEIGGYQGFPDNALVFYFDSPKSIRVVVRPSGTEPKIKFYVAVGDGVSSRETSQEYDAVKKECDDLAHKILEEFVAIADKISSGGEKFEILG